ncbi:MAG: CBS domain-containing protein [Saprospiraceae bacterium]|nr:CBS domain-containing protein [Saprospiraceae bacterium]
MAINIYAPVSTIMTTKLITVHPKDTLAEVKEIFDTHKIHHVPVVKYKEIVGIISKMDMLQFLRGTHNSPYAEVFEKSRLKSFTAGEIMTAKLAKLEKTDRINVALEVFKENLFHAIPVIEGGELVGLVTTYDIIAALADETVQNEV